ncbi:MAG: leucine-rich repeat domain-containing protein [Clostridia bacterium]|nr:leucine-rich repeat domain-containing protein [Clostridia bacterium]
MIGHEMYYGFWRYTTDANGQVTLMAYNGPGGTVCIPRRIAGRPVIRLAAQLFREDQCPIGRDGMAADPVEAAIIPEGVLEIGEMAFYCCRSLQRVRLPRSLRTLGRDAFSFCGALEEISLPDGVQELPEGVFEGCTSLRAAWLPGALHTIGERAFAACGSLRDCPWPQGLQCIDDYAFEGCGMLSPGPLPRSVAYVGVDAFAGCRPATFAWAG